MKDISKHTPGPWRFDESGPNLWIRHDGIGFPVADVASVGSMGCNTHHETRKANALLIAAAPELKESLMAAYDVINYLGDILNEMCCVSQADELYTTPRIELIKKTLESIGINTKSQDDLTEIIEE